MQGKVAKKMFVVVIAVMMIISMIPMTTFAEEAGGSKEPALAANCEDDQTVYPAMRLTGSAGSVTVTLTAPEGSLPEGTTLSCSLAGQAYVDAVANELEAQGQTLTDAVAIDVTPLDKNGREVQPKVPVKVTFSGTSLDVDAGDTVDVFRVSDDASTVTDMGGNGNADRQTFTTDHFTIYVSVGSGSRWDPNGDGTSRPNDESNPYELDYGDSVTLHSNNPDNEIIQYYGTSWDCVSAYTGNYKFDFSTAQITNKNASDSEEIVQIRHKYNPYIDETGVEFFWVKLLPAVKYSVVFYANAEGVTGLPDAVTVNGKQSGRIEVSLPNTKPERDGYSFNGWAMDASATAPDASAGGTFTFDASKADSDGTIELYALWKETTTVEYKAESHGSVSSSGEEADRHTPADLAGSTATPDTGYELEGWYVGDKKVADTETLTSDQVTANLNTREEDGQTVYTDTTFTAKFTPIVYTITYDLDGGASTGLPTEYTIESSEIILYNKPTKEHFEFVGWTGTDLTEPTIFPIIPKGSTGNRVYTANWQDEYCTIRFECDRSGGTLVATNEETGEVLEVSQFYDFVKYGDPTPEVTARPNDGVHFAGWQKDTGKLPLVIQLEVDPTVTQEVTYRALWGYGITYDLNGGSVDGDNPTAYSKEYEDFTLINPTKPGYTFVGWTGTDLTEPTMEVTVDTSSAKDLSYTANWERIKYEVQFKYGVQGNLHGKLNYDGSTSQNFLIGSLYYGDPMPAVTPVPDEGYEFAGWKKSTAEDPDAVQDTLDETVTENVIYTATWKPEKVTYKVNFYYQIPNSEDFKLVKTDDRSGYSEEDAVVTDADRVPEDQGDGYTYDFYLVKSDSKKTIAADGSTELNVYFWPQYKITFLAGDHGMLTDAGGDEVDQLNFTRHYGDATPGASTWEKRPDPKYTFDSWDPEVADKVTGNATYTARWKGNYKVTFDANGHGTAPSAQTVEEGKKAEKPADPTASGYTFGGWYTDNECKNAYSFDTAVTKDITLYAKWTENDSEEPSDQGATKFTIGYDLNGGTLDGKTGVIIVQAEKGSTITIPDAPTREGYTFTYWKGSEYHPGDSYIVEGDHTFTAQWKENEAKTYKVTFDANGHGTAPSAQTVEEGKTAEKPADPKASGYTFGGWYTDNECKNAYSFDTAVTKDITLYAKWTKNSSPSDGSDGSSSSTSGDTAENSDGSSSSTSDGTAEKSDGSSSSTSGDTAAKTDGSSSSTSDVTAAKTGDESNGGLWFMLMAVSILALVFIVSRRRLRNR